MSVLDLKAALREALEQKGVLGAMKAQMQSEVFTALDDADDPRPRLSDENMLINELIREYLHFNSYRHALSVFLSETGQPEQSLNREVLAQRTHLPAGLCSSGEAGPAGAQLPLLYALLAPPPPPDEPAVQPTGTAPATASVPAPASTQSAHARAGVAAAPATAPSCPPLRSPLGAPPPTAVTPASRGWLPKPVVFTAPAQP